jgi:prephenate dehydratase
VFRIAYLGPNGTFTEDALFEAIDEGAFTFEPGTEFELLRMATVHEAILAVEQGQANRALAPFENSIEGSVRSTLDTLALDTEQVTIIGEYDFTVHAQLLMRTPIPLSDVAQVYSHPQPLAQCARFLREKMPGAERLSVNSTAEAARIVGASTEPWAAIGARSAVKFYGCTIVCEDIEDEATNVTRFVWLAPTGTETPAGKRWKTSLVFSELGEDHPGALVEALQEFSSREVNLARIESRPLRQELGRYMFFCDLEGALSEAAVNEAVEALRSKADSVRILGSYPTA